MELLSAAILARLGSTIAEALQQVAHINKVHCWLDSLTVLYWIRQENKEWKPFVKNRVAEVRKIAPLSSWLHCPSEANMANVAKATSNQSTHQVIKQYILAAFDKYL